jgi:hypothetical protein
MPPLVPLVVRPLVRPLVPPKPSPVGLPQSISLPTILMRGGTSGGMPC